MIKIKINIVVFLYVSDLWLFGIEIKYKIFKVNNLNNCFFCVFFGKVVFYFDKWLYFNFVRLISFLLLINFNLLKLLVYILVFF